jgi:hypothetical protein
MFGGDGNATTGGAMPIGHWHILPGRIVVNSGKVRRIGAPRRRKLHARSLACMALKLNLRQCIL